jgi:hypothetical protein
MSAEEAAPPSPSRAHRGLGLALIVVASLLSFLAIFALWANRQLLNTDNWTETSTELLENEDIRDQVAIFLVDELYANVDVQADVSRSSGSFSGSSAPARWPGPSPVA